MVGPRAWVRAARGAADQHPRLALAPKAAAAAALAWLVVQPLGGVADRYRYYAPLGAVIAVSTTLAGSVRESLQGVVAIMLGATVALAAGVVPVKEVLALAAVVAVGTLVAGWQWLGAKATWVPVSALFVLIVGRTDPMDYVIGYLGLTALGALVGVGLNALFPPLPLSPTQAAVSELRETLADQLDSLSDGLLSEEPLTAEEWRKREWSLEPLSLRSRAMVDHASDARRANWRARRYRDRADRLYEQGRSLRQLAFLVEDLTDLVTGQERAERESAALGPRLRPYAAHALAAMAEMLRDVDGTSADEETLDRTRQEVDRLAEEIHAMRAHDGDALDPAGTIVTTIRRGIEAVTPRQPEDSGG